MINMNAYIMLSMISLGCFGNKIQKANFLRFIYCWRKYEAKQKILLFPNDTSMFAVEAQ